MWNLNQWARLHPHWSQKVWTERDLLWLKHRTWFDIASWVVPKDAVNQFRADIARYEILYRHGGFYADVDTYPLNNIAEALEGHDAFAAAEDSHWVGNTYLGAVAGHPVMKELMDGLFPSIKMKRGQRPNRITGPRYLTPIWHRHGCYVAPQRLWYPYSYTNVKQGNIPVMFGGDVMAVHEWGHTREVLGLD